jgi:hypothetical protein
MIARIWLASAVPKPKASGGAHIVNSGASGSVGVKELVYLAICGLVAVAIYFAWQYLGLSNSHLKPGHEQEPTESLNDH